MSGFKALASRALREQIALERVPGLRQQHTLSSVVDHLCPAVAKFHEVVAESARGCWVKTTSGDKLLDLTSGIGVTSTGHSHPKVIEAIHAQANKIIFAQQNILPATPASIKLVNMLDGVMPKTLSRYFFCNSGSEAVDNAIKVARNFTGKMNVIAMHGGYHGRTYGAMSLTTSKTIYRQTFGPMPAGVAVANYPYCLRCPTRKAAGGMDFSVSPCVPGVGLPYENRRCCGAPVEDLHNLLQTQSHPSETAAIIIEPILGEGGFLVPPPGFLEELRHICDQNNMLLIFDEVQSGVGRTGEWWAHQALSSVQPDIMVFAKGIASGFPFAGLATRDDVFSKMTPGQMGGTYGGSALGCAAAVGTLEAIIEDDMLINAKARGAQFMKGLVDLSGKYPIAEVRGRGLMIAVEFDGPPGTASRLVQEGFDLGLLLITAGINQSVRLLPPLCISEEEVALALDKLDLAMEKTFS
jgi:4-aminobutyrate aminotransferase